MDHLSGLVFRRPQATLTADLWSIFAPPFSDGRLHVAFGVSPADLDGWERRVRDAGIEIESLIDWPEGGRSLYFRDPDGHAIELKTSSWRGRPFD